jgi:hypothetical protein
MPHEHDSRFAVDVLAGDARNERAIALRALQVVEYALAAPAPRRHRTWLHRVSVAVEALDAAIRAQLPRAEQPVRLLDEIALTHPGHLPRIQALQQALHDLSIATASIRELIEADVDLDPGTIRDRLSTLSRQFRAHEASEADLVYEAIGLELDTT